MKNQIASVSLGAVFAAIGLLPSTSLQASPGDENTTPIPVEVVQAKTGEWQLLRGGEPYYVKGGCRGGNLLEELAAAGGNSIRELIECVGGSCGHCLVGDHS